MDMGLLGQFAVIMADPPWDIRIMLLFISALRTLLLYKDMELPYGTLNDSEMKSLNVGPLQSEGFFFLWVTGRAMELGRECLQIWGYL